MTSYVLQYMLDDERSLRSDVVFFSFTHAFTSACKTFGYDSCTSTFFDGLLCLRYVLTSFLYIGQTPFFFSLSAFVSPPVAAADIRNRRPPFRNNTAFYKICIT